MPLTSVCPDPQILQRLLLGQVSPAEAPLLGEHLLHCEQCAQTLHSL